MIIWPTLVQKFCNISAINVSASCANNYGRDRFRDMAEMSRARYSIATLKVEIFMDQFMPQFDPYEIVDS